MLMPCCHKSLLWRALRNNALFVVILQQFSHRRNFAIFQTSASGNTNQLVAYVTVAWQWSADVITWGKRNWLTFGKFKSGWARDVYNGLIMMKVQKSSHQSTHRIPRSTLDAVAMTTTVTSISLQIEDTWKRMTSMSDKQIWDGRHTRGIRHECKLFRSRRRSPQNDTPLSM